MNIELRQEQKRVDSVMETITEQINRLEDETTQASGTKWLNIRKHFWDEVKVNTDTFDDYLETIIGLRQEAQALSVSQSTHRHASKRLSTLRRMQEVPYFGRIDFIEEGTSTVGTNLYRHLHAHGCKWRKFPYLRLEGTGLECLLRLPAWSGQVCYTWRRNPWHFGEKVAISHPRRRYPIDVRYESHYWRRNFTAGAWQRYRQTYAQYSSYYSTGAKPDHPA